MAGIAATWLARELPFPAAFVAMACHEESVIRQSLNQKSKNPDQEMRFVFTRFFGELCSLF